MSYVTDTHSLIWHMTDDPKLSVEAKRVFTKVDNVQEYILYLARNLNEGGLVKVKQELAINGSIVSKQIYKILTDLTGEARFDMVLHLATKDLLRLKIQEVEREIRAFEERYHMNFDDFRRAWDERKIADRNSYEVEKDYWDWEALVTNREHLEEMLGFLL